MPESQSPADDLRLWFHKWREYQREVGPLSRARLHYELARRQSFARGPLRGNILQMLREERLTIGSHCNFEPHVWLTSTTGRITIGEGVFLNLGVMVAAQHRVEIGDHCMIGNGSTITDANHRFNKPDVPVPWQGFISKGPVIIGDNVWLGANVTVTSGVKIGKRCVVGANSVVSEDLPAFTIAAGNPAKVIRTIEYRAKR